METLSKTIKKEQLTIVKTIVVRFDYLNAGKIKDDTIGWMNNHIDPTISTTMTITSF
jgi:hypothetical protein